jgi:tRNA(Ile)-lysidine synthase
MTFSVTRLGDALGALTSALPSPVAGYCLGLSGGLDSMCLLRALVELREAGALASVRALHVDHGWTAQSPEWARRCVDAAQRLGVTCEVVRVAARGARGTSPEAAARAARYAAFAAALRPHEALLTAHNADDQLETALLQWVRGGGLRALAAMPPMARFGPGWHLRPLLGFERAELCDWARATAVTWIEDPSNADQRYDRAFLRHEIVSRLRARWPSVARTVARVALYAAEAVELEEGIAATDLRGVADGRTLALDRLLELPGARRRAVVRRWVRAQGLAVPEARTLAGLLHDVERAAVDRVPVTRWPGGEVHRYRGRLYALSAPACAAFAAGSTRPGERFELATGMTLEWQRGRGNGLSCARLPGQLEVRSRRGGERFHERGAPHSQPLRKWLQERGVVPWQRAAIPLLIADGRLLAVGDLAYSGEFAADADEESWRLAWTGRPPLLEAEFVSEHLYCEVAG